MCARNLPVVRRYENGPRAARIARADAEDLGGVSFAEELDNPDPSLGQVAHHSS